MLRLDGWIMKFFAAIFEQCRNASTFPHNQLPPCPAIIPTTYHVTACGGRVLSFKTNGFYGTNPLDLSAHTYLFMKQELWLLSYVGIIEWSVANKESHLTQSSPISHDSIRLINLHTRSFHQDDRVALYYGRRCLSTFFLKPRDYCAIVFLKFSSLPSISP